MLASRATRRCRALQGKPHVQDATRARCRPDQASGANAIWPSAAYASRRSITTVTAQNWRVVR
jgi:hypothetical protein